MSVDESMIHDIVQKVMANMQIASPASGMHGVFQDMNEAIKAFIHLCPFKVFSFSSCF